MKSSDSIAQLELVEKLSDEFEASEVNWKKWYKKSMLPNTSGWKCNNEDNVKIVNGIAELTMKHNADDQGNKVACLYRVY
ncbi:MAG: hypothetical protein ACON5F_04505 [Jejuia sp.]